MTTPIIQPQIKASLRLILTDHPCNGYLLDVYGTFCSHLSQFDVEAVALAGHKEDVSALFNDYLEDIQAVVDESNMGAEEAASRRAESRAAFDAMFCADLENLDALGVASC